MIEIILSIITTRQLVWGKIAGLSAVALTQLTVLCIAIFAIWQYTQQSLPIAINWEAVAIDPTQVALSLFYTLCGFLIMAAIMVGVGAAMPSYKEAQNFSSFFVIASIFPIYFASIIVQDPSGLIARTLSYFPLTAPLILLARNVLGALSITETVLSSVLLITYVVGSLILAQKLFEVGALEFSNKLSFKRIFKS